MIKSVLADPIFNARNPTKKIQTHKTLSLPQSKLTLRSLKNSFLRPDCAFKGTSQKNKASTGVSLPYGT